MTRTLTGSVIVEHDSRVGLHETILRSLGAADLPRSLARNPVMDLPAMRLAELCLKRLLERMLEHVLRVAVGMA